MGMYTQIRGWLNVDSIGNNENFELLARTLESTKDYFENDDTIVDVCGNKLERKWVCNDTYIHQGGNGSIYIFFGTELKNYGCPAEIWIKYLLEWFPNAEGRIDFQYEEDEVFCKYWLITKGKIFKQDLNPVWCEGYGNMYNLR